MSIGLTEATAILTGAPLYLGDDTYDTDRLHRAIKAAGLHFMREVPCSITTASITLDSGESTLDMTAEVDRWVDTQFIRASINNIEVFKTDDGTVRRQWQAGTPDAGRPTQVTTPAPNDWLFNRPTDQQYTLKVTYRAQFTDFTPGSASDPTLNIPDEYLYDVIHFGALAYLLKGVKEEHPEALPAMREFKQFVKASQAKFGVTDSGITDNQVTD